MEEGEAFRQLWVQLWETFADKIFRAEHGFVDAAYHFFEEIDGAVGGSYHTFPVPLIDVERVEITQLLIGTNGVHVGVNAVAFRHRIFGQSETLGHLLSP